MKRNSRYLIPLNLQLFSEPPKEDDPTPDPTPDPAKPDDKHVPYDRFKAVNDELKSLKAFGTADDIAAKLAELDTLKKDADERKKAEMTEAQRLQAERDELAAKATDAEKRAAELEQARTNDKIEFAITQAAAGAVDLEAVLAFVDRSALKVEDGKVVGVQEAIEALKTAKPYLFASQEPKKPKHIGDENNPAKQDEVKTLEAQLEDARKKGVFSEVVRLSNLLKQKLGN